MDLSILFIRKQLLAFNYDDLLLHLFFLEDMRKLHFALLTLFVSLVGQQSSAYQITFTSNYTSGKAYLTYYLGSNMYVEDSAMVNNKGTATFKQAKKLPGGIYAIVFPGNRFSTDFLIDTSQKIIIVADTANMLNIKLTGSPENVLFQQYQQYVNQIGPRISAARQAYTQSTSQKDSLIYEKEFTTLNQDLNNYRINLMEKNPNAMITALFNAMKESPLPEKTPVTRQDSVDNFNYYKKHYWDGISFMDDRIVRTPFFLPKLEKYYREVIGQSAPDSIIKDIDYKLLLARSAPEMYKYLLNWLTDEFINPKYMGQDAIFVHLFNQYHSKGLTNWLNEKQLETISNRAYMLMANLIGESAADLQMLNVADKPISLYDINADYTVMIFWDPTCGHCKEELPKIDSIYRATWKAKGVKIFAVLTDKTQTEWRNYIQKNDLGDWVNVYETKAMSDKISAERKPSFRQLYDVTMTPTLFLLDKDKRIIAKKLTWQQINDLLQVKWADKTP